MNNPKVLVKLVCKNISSISHDKEKILKHLSILSKLLKYNWNERNTVNEQCSQALDVAYCVYVDIPNILKPDYWYTVVLIEL